jgi:malonate transporter MadM subunit
VAFALMLVAGWLSETLTRGRLQGSAIAILLGLVLAYWGGRVTGGEHGLADFAALWAESDGRCDAAGLRDRLHRHGVDLKVIKRAGLSGGLSVLLGVLVSFVVGAVVAAFFGYTDAKSLATIGAGAATYIVGPVTGTAVGASSDVIALSVAAGLVKSVVVMVGTPLIAPLIGLNNPKSAMAFGGLLGTTSGVAGGLAATRQAPGPLRSHDGHFLHGRRLPARPVTAVHGVAGDRGWMRAIAGG